MEEVFRACYVCASAGRTCLSEEVKKKKKKKRAGTFKATEQESKAS